MNKTPKIISINIQKGGTSKTTTTQAIGEILVKNYNKKVLLLDLDPQANLTFSSGLNPDECDYDICDVLKDEVDINDAIIKTKYYSIIAGSILLSSADTMFTQVGKEHLLENKLKEIKEDFDFILLDNCPALNLLNIMALTAVSSNGGVIIPLEPSRFCLTGLEQLVNHMKLIKQYYNNNLKILGLLVVRFKSNTNLNKTILNNLPNIAINYDTNLFKTCIRNSIKIPENQLLGIPISDDKSNALTDYENFVNELLEVL